MLKKHKNSNNDYFKLRNGICTFRFLMKSVFSDTRKTYLKIYATDGAEKLMIFAIFKCNENINDFLFDFFLFTNSTFCANKFYTVVIIT